MQNRSNLSIKVANPVAIVPDAPFTPIDQTLQTPIEVPKLNSYFPISNPQSGTSASIYSNAAYSESEDILTDVDESGGPNISRTYSLSFTPQFDDLLMKVYSTLTLLPTVTPFSGNIPPLGIVSRVANETMATLNKLMFAPEYEMIQPTFDVQEIITKERMRNAAFKHILVLLIRRRLIDLCTAQFNRYTPNYSPQLCEPTSTQIMMSALASNGSSGNGFCSSIYGSMGWNPLSLSSLSLSEQASTRLRSSSLNLRKQSLSRNNSCSASSWLHIGSIVNSRSGHGQSFNLNHDMNASTDSIQLMHDYVSASVVPRSSNVTSSVSSPIGASNNSNATTSTFGHGLVSQLSVLTPPGVNKGPFTLDTITPPAFVRRESALVAQKLNFEERPLLARSRSHSRGNVRNLHPGPLILNTDPATFNNHNLGHGEAESEFTLNSPFVSAISLDDYNNHYGQSALDTSSVTCADDGPSSAGLRSGRLIVDSPVAETQSQSHRANLGSEFSLSERKRDSLKLKRGII